MRFIIDAQLPPRLADWLRAQGHDAVAVRDIGLRDAPDQEIWQRAAADGAVIVTKDDDFAILVTRRGPPPQVLWVRTGNVLTPDLLQRFAVVWVQAEALLAEGAPLVELR